MRKTKTHCFYCSSYGYPTLEDDGKWSASCKSKHVKFSGRPSADVALKDWGENMKEQRRMEK